MPELSLPHRPARPSISGGIGRCRHIGVVAAVVSLLVTGAAVAPPSSAAPPSPGGGEKIRSGLLATMQDKGEAPFWVSFRDRPDLSQAGEVGDWAGRGQAVVSALTATADASQAKVRALLRAAKVEYTPFWVTNAIYVHNASLALAQLLAADTGVAALLPATTFRMPEPSRTQAIAATEAVEWNVAAIHADQVWSQFGDTGSGIVVASIDTGVQYTHPALVARYRGSTGNGFNHSYNWYDPSQVCPAAEPCDNHGHGTHTMGTMVGDDGAGNRIGVAPGARWIAAKGCETGNCSDFALIASGQWLLAPTDLTGQNPRPDLRPNVVNNSWGGDPDLAFYDDVLAAWRAAGIFPAFANGNSGPGCDTATSPGDRDLAYSTGAFDTNGTIASFSSRGPGTGDHLKPNIAAPGVAVRSSVPTNGYTALSGTSMAAPHLAATVALIWSAAPSLVGDIPGTEALLDRTAADVEDTSCGGTTADNNVYGEGRLDALAAVQAAPRAPSGTLTGTLTDAATRQPVSGIVTAVSGSVARSAFAGADGGYLIQAPPGVYTITATAFSYRDRSVTATVTAGETTTIDIALDPQPAFAVRGTVTDDATDKPVPGAILTVVGTPLSATTDTLGGYRFARVPTGDHTLAVTPAAADNCLQGSQRRIRVQRDTVQNLSIGHVRDPYGYTCGYEPTRYIEADDTILPFEVQPPDRNFDQEMRVTLPFPIYLYERGYRGGTAYVSNKGQVNLNEAGDTSSGARGARALAFPFSDGYLRVRPDTRVATETRGRAPHRTFTVEWRNIGHWLDPSFEVDTEVTFHENGEIVFAYRDIDQDNRLEQGAGAWALIGEPYMGSTRRFLFSSDDEPTFTNARQIRYTPPDRGLLSGRVTDATDRRPIANAPIRITDRHGNEMLHHVRTDADGRYSVPLRLGDYTVTAEPFGYQPQPERISIRKDGQHQTGVARLRTAVIDTNPDALRITVDRRASGSATLTLTNTGDATLTWRGAEIADPAASGGAGEKLGQFSAGDTFVVTGVARAADGNLWVSGVDLAPDLPVRIRQYRPDGTPTGTVYDPAARWGLPPGTILLDLTYLATVNLICAVAEGANASIYCFDPGTGALRRTLNLDRLTHEATGLAHDQANDVFYVTGTTVGLPLFTGGVTAVAGLHHAGPGRILSRCGVDFQAGGAGYHPTSHTLWVAGDADPYTEGLAAGYWVHQVDPRTCQPISRFHYTEDWSTGLDVDPAGSLWITGGGLFSRFRGRILHYGTGDPVEADAPWLSLSHTHGVLKPRKSITITLTANLPGDTTTASATLRLIGNAGRGWDIRIPITASRRNQAGTTGE